MLESMGYSKLKSGMTPRRSSTGKCTTPVIYPSDNGKMWWDTLIALFILYSAVMVPVRLGFGLDAHGSAWALEVLISLFFLCDVGVNFFTAYNVDGEWIASHRLIAARYLRGWFWVDAPSGVPVELLELAFVDLATGEGLPIGALRMLRILRLIRLLRLLKLDSMLSDLEDALDLNLRALRLWVLIVKVLVMAHFFGCGWMALTLGPARTGEMSWIEEYNDGVAADGPFWQQCTRSSERGAALATLGFQPFVWNTPCSLCRLARAHEPSHPSHQPPLCADFYAFYFALGALLGHSSDIEPTTDNERLYCMMMTLMSAFVFAYIIGEIASLVAQLDRQALMVEEKMDSIKDYLRWRKVPRKTSMEIRRYYEHFFTATATAFDETDILVQLPPKLHSHLVQHILQDKLGETEDEDEGSLLTFALALDLAPTLALLHRHHARPPHHLPEALARLYAQALPVAEAALCARGRDRVQKGRGLEGAPLPIRGRGAYMCSWWSPHPLVAEEMGTMMFWPKSLASILARFGRDAGP